MQGSYSVTVLHAGVGARAAPFQGEAGRWPRPAVRTATAMRHSSLSLDIRCTPDYTWMQ